MLIGIDPLLPPELLCILRAMGHGDDIAIVDANYPAANDARRLVRLDGCTATRALSAVVSVLPLDGYVDYPVHTMEVVGDPRAVPEIVAGFKTIVAATHGDGVGFGTPERFAFYEAVRSAFAVVVTGERRLYGNILLKKGVIDPDV